MSGGGDRRDEAFAFAAVGVTWVFGTMALIGPVALLVAVVTMSGILIAGYDERISLLTSAAGVGLGSLLWGFEGWLVDPINTMVAIYRDYLFDGQRIDIEGLPALFLSMLVNGPAWPYFAPLGIVAGGLYATCWQVLTGSPLRRTTRVMPCDKVTSGVMTRFAKRRVDDADALIGDSTLLGVDKHARKRVTLSDADANKHTLVLGTTGSGKTVSVLNMVEGAIDRQQAVVYVDGKGDYDLADKILSYAVDQGRPAYLFAMNGKSCVYNPLASGGYSAKKDRIVELREWSEDHYRKLAEGYMQIVFKVLEATGIDADLVTVADYMSMEKLAELVEDQGDSLPDHERYLDAIAKREAAEEHVQSLKEEIWTLAESEIGHLFDTDRCPRDRLLELLPAIEEQAVVYFCLPALQFPALARLIGRLVINDLKSAAAAQVAKPRHARMPFTTVFDEFSVFAGDQVLNLINQGRSAGVRGVLATQSVADIGRAVANGPDHFIRQVFASCNSYLIQRLNADDDVTAMVELIGTRDTIEHTAQVDLLGATGLGSARRTKSFTVHPDIIKQLRVGEAVFVNKNQNTTKHILVRHSRIERHQ